MRHQLIRPMEQNPVVPALKDPARLAECLHAGSGVVFVLCGDILNIGELIDRLHRGGKKAVIHADLVTGLAPKEIAADFLQRCGADGIISTRPALIRRGRELGLLTILRVFALDSKAISNLRGEVDSCAPDMIEILPGTLPRTLSRLSRELKIPLIAGGLIRSKPEVIQALQAGVIAVSSSCPDVWEMSAHNLKFIYIGGM